MASKKPAPDDLLAELDSLQSQATSRPSKTSNTRTSRPGQPTQSSQSEQDILADLGNLAQRPASRPGTPSLRNNPPSTSGNRSPKRTSTATPPPGRTSEEKSNNGQRKSGDSARSYHQSFTPATTTTETSTDGEQQSTPAPARSGSSWWGGILSTASAAVSQAQAAVKEIQKNEEAQKWAEQVKGNVGSLRGLGDLRSLAMPAFQNILQTIAPPISSHERLQIHITHDLLNYPTLDPLIYQVFSRIMSQVEGGDLMVIQRGQEAAPKRDSKDLPQRSVPLGSWHDGPWWRSDEQRSVNAVKGLLEGTKLVRTSAENYATEYFASRGGLDEVVKRVTQTPSESNPTRNSEIFLAIQAISQDLKDELFAASTGNVSSETEGQVKEIVDEKTKEEILFAIYLHDPIHGIAFHTVSQALPHQWIEWLDAPGGGEGILPESIEEIIASGGIDPREWVSEWVEETLNLAIGIVAQRYVARRMGVGEAGIRKGKLRADKATENVMESGGGEAARALGGM